MATSKEYFDFVCGQLDGIGGVTGRKLFGEYLIYIHEKPVLLVCDNTVMVKKVPELAALFSGAPEDVPYEGARPHYVLDIEDRELVRAAVEVQMCIRDRPWPAPRPRASTSSSPAAAPLRRCRRQMCIRDRQRSRRGSTARRRPAHRSEVRAESVSS